MVTSTHYIKWAVVILQRRTTAAAGAGAAVNKQRMHDWTVRRWIGEVQQFTCRAYGMDGERKKEQSTENTSMQWTAMLFFSVWFSVSFTLAFNCIYTLFIWEPFLLYFNNELHVHVWCVRLCLCKRVNKEKDWALGMSEREAENSLVPCLKKPTTPLTLCCNIILLVCSLSNQKGSDFLPSSFPFWTSITQTLPQRQTAHEIYVVKKEKNEAKTKPKYTHTKTFAVRDLCCCVLFLFLF